MPQTSGLLHNGKPIVEVAIADALPMPGAVSAVPVSASFNLRTYRALIDTGADISAINRGVVRDFGLQRTGSLTVVSGSGQAQHKTHIVQLGIWCEAPRDTDGDETPTRTLYQLAESLHVIQIAANTWFDVILGTDVLRHHELRIKRDHFVLILGEA